MGQRYTIDIEARFVDHVTGESKSATAAVDNLGTVAEQTQKKLQKLTRSRAQIEIDANNSKLIRKIRQWESKAYELGNKKTVVTLDAIDKATMKFKMAMGTAKNYSAQAYNAVIRANNSQAMAAFKGVLAQGKSLAGKTWTAMVKIKDLATTPLTKIKNSLFSIKSLVTAITAGLAAKQFVINPINLADQYSSAKIGFSTLLGEERGQAMMDEIDAFAKATPFKTSGVISNVQKMMAYGWDVERVIEDMETIGDAAAATGKGDEGLASIVYALSEIRSKGKLSTQELNQLASAGIKAKAYLAEGLGFGTSDEGMKKLSDALESGAIGANAAIDMILEGMKEFDGMMDKTANETVEGLWSQIQDTFEINVFRRWGQGLQDGAKKGMGTIVDLLDSADEGIGALGDTLYDIGKVASNWVADKLAGAVRDIKEITASPEFQEAGWWEKVNMLWDGVIGNPFAKWWKGTVVPWWDDYAVPWLSNKAASLGEGIGKGLTGGLMALLGVDYVGAAEDGASIAGGFVKGFREGFDGSAITEAFVDAISDIWDALPWWGKLLIGGYGTAKVAGGISSLFGGVKSFIGTAGGRVLADGSLSTASGLLGVLGRTGNTIVEGSGVLGSLANAGYSLTGGVAGSSLSGGAAALVGALPWVGLGTGVVTMGSGISDLVKGYKHDDSAGKQSGWWKVGGAAGGAAAGAAIGSIIPGVGTLIGASVGALAGSAIGWIGSNQAKKNAVEAARMNGSLEELANSESAAAEKAQELLEEMEALAAADMAAHFGDVALSMAEIKNAASDIIGQDFFTQANAAMQAIEDMESAEKAFISSDYAMQKSTWLAAMKEDAKLTDDEINALKEDYTAFINSASSLLSSKQYASESSILGILGDSEAAEQVLKASRQYYGNISTGLAKATNDYNQALTNALQDGVLSIDEKASLDKLRDQINRVTAQLELEEYETGMSAIQSKYSLDKMDDSSFIKLMKEMAEQTQPAIDNFWKQFAVGSKGLDANSAEYKTLYEGTLGQIAGALENAGGFGLDKIQSTYSKELGILGHDLSDILKNNTGEEIRAAAAGLTEDTKASLYTMLDAMAPTTEQIETLAQQYREAGLAIPEALNSYLQTVEFYEALAAGPEAIEEYFKNTTINIEPTAARFDGSNLVNAINALELQAEAHMGVAWTYDEFDQEWITPDGQYSFTTQALVEAGWTYNPFLKEWISPDGTYSFHTGVNVKANYSVNQFNGSQSTFGVNGPYNASATVNVTARYRLMNTLALNTLLDNAPNGPKQFRGGIVGGSSALEGFADGGMVGGGARLITVAEEGSPEMIIPLSSQRRDRGLQLWRKAGEMMGVPGFARGGMTDGSQDEGFRFRGYDTGENAGGGSTQVDVGGITLQIHVDGNSGGSIVDAIKAQANEIVETVAGIINDALGSQYENTPARGGAS